MLHAAMDGSVRGCRASHADSNLVCLQCALPLLEPRQASCGDRVCSGCFSTWRRSATEKVTCPKCNSPILTIECFRDRAAEVELKSATFQCVHPECTWSGANTHFRDHLSHCRFAPATSPNSGYGFAGGQAEFASNLVKCFWCGESIRRDEEEEHVSLRCAGSVVPCSAGCGQQIVRREMAQHLESACPKQNNSRRFNDLECDFVGNGYSLVVHQRDATPNHLMLVTESLQEEVECDSPSPSTTEFRAKVERTVRQVASTHKELSRLHDKMESQLAPLRESLLKLEATLADFQESFGDLSLMVQTLQATSYDGKFVWKIPEVARRKNEAILGKTISLYSAPFFTSRFGYKMCLRLYLNGDGVGKGTHLSFFLTIMRGEYDALLSWPFLQTVTLMLLDQDKRKDIIQAFRPEPASSSFWQPKTEMNIASGCPRFAPLSVLNNPSYVRGDVMFLMATVD